jgi:hypothetical protein
MNRLSKLSVTTALLFLGLSCCRELVPPAIDLKTYEVVGIVKFNTNAQGNLNGYATQKFIEWLRRDQKGIRIIELGTEADVLAAVGKKRIDPDAVKEIAKKYNIKTLITGELSISNVRPRVAITPGFKWVSVSGDVDATLSASMIETETGASVWTGSGRAEREVGNISMIDGKFSFGVDNPDSAQGKLVEELVKKLTRDFRNSWRCK